MKKNLLIFFLIINFSFVQAQYSFSGKVVDKTTQEGLPFATIIIAGTSQGTVMNSQGEFQLHSEKKEITIIASYIGYISDSIKISLYEKRNYIFALTPIPVSMQEVVITDEDPAYEIIRRAIESKKKWKKSLTSYEGNAFTRMQVSDTGIAAVMESYSTLYWRERDTVREVVTQQRQTGNLPKSFQPTTVGRILNFNDDEIQHQGFTFISVTHPNAFSYYDYKLVKIRKMDDFEIYDIQIIPKSSSMPLFSGKISIAERSYAVMEVDVVPNEAFVFPFINMNNSHFQQQFRLYENKFWMPANYRYTVSMGLSIVGISIPTISVEKNVVMYNYSLNTTLADSIFSKSKTVVDSSSKNFDSTYWANNNVLPLTPQQTVAYKTLDSTQSLEKRFQPKGVLTSLGNNDNFLKYPDIYFNRVEGLHVGIENTFKDVFSFIDINAHLGYGISNKQWNYNFGIEKNFGEKVKISNGKGMLTIGNSTEQFSLSTNFYKTISPIISSKPYPYIATNIGNLFSKIDYYDYYQANGAKIHFDYLPISTIMFSVGYTWEKQFSVHNTTNYSFFSRSDLYRENPPIVEGNASIAHLTIKYGDFLLSDFANTLFQPELQIDYTSPYLQSDFNYRKISFNVKTKFITMNENLLFPPALYIMLYSGIAEGKLPPQEYFEPLTQYGGSALKNSLRGMNIKEFHGDRYVTVIMEHNFRRLPFLAISNSFFKESNLEFLVRASVMQTWITKNSIVLPENVIQATEGWYYEAGIGINNIFDILRADITWRGKAPQGIFFTLSVADLFDGLISNK